ncbi:MAG TPA: response regulator, partial [Candidatus Acidoferrum sp.]|nr:response regulator [Candidatus Acidoferrum sp.]
MGKRAARTAIVPRVALIGPDAAVLEEWACDLRPHHLVARLGDPERAVRQVESERFEVMVVDLDFRDASAIGLLGRLRWAHPGAETIVVSEPVPADIVVAAMRLGASDFLCKPLAGPDALARHVAEAVARGKSAEPRPDSPVEMLCGAGVPGSGGRPPNYMRERRRLLA